MALKIGKIRHKPGVHFYGPFAGPDPFSRFNTPLAQYLLSRGHYDPGLYPEQAALPGPLPVALEGRVGRVAPALSVHLEHRLAPDFRPPTGGYWVLGQPWEYGSLPRTWYEPLRYTADEIWVHTPWGRESYLAEGLEVERVHVVPPGIDTHIFSPQAQALTLPEARAFRFLFVGDLHWASGLDLLLQAWREEFLPDEPVSLVVVDNQGVPMSLRSEFREQVLATQADPEAAPVLLIEQPLTESERAGVYRACDCVVLPYRAEGFGTAVIEALACGVPVMVTDLGAWWQLDERHLTLFQGRSLRGHEARIGGVETVNPPTWKEPPLAELRYRLRAALEDPAPLQAQAQLAAPLVAEAFGWEQITIQVEQRLDALRQRPIYREYQADLQHATLQGLEAFTIGEFDRARTLLEAVVVRDPHNPVLRLDAGTACLQAGDNTAALSHFAAALPLSPHQPHLLSVSGIALYRSGAWALAEQCFQRALALAPEHTGARESLATLQKEHPQLPEVGPEWAEWQALLGCLPAIDRPQRLSLCMIVKNEEQFLRQCLESVQTVVDEIIVVDTGSSDRTCEIAEEFGAKVSHFAWTGSFAEARNAALEQATGDWVLVLDADEVIEPGTLLNIRELIQIPQPTLSGYQLKIRNFSQDGNEVDVVEHYMMRLFPRHPSLRFQGGIHEQLVCSDESLGFERLTTTDILILHYGYTGQLMNERDKYNRNLALLEQARDREPENPFHYFNLGLTHRVQHEESKALAYFQRAVELCTAKDIFPPYMSATYCYIASLHLALGEFATALEVCETAPDMCHDNPDYWVNYGTACNSLGNYTEAIEKFKRASALRRQGFTSMVSDRAATTWKPLAGIGNSYLMLQRPEQADLYFRRALRENPHSAEIRLGLGRLALFRQRYDEAEGYFQALLAMPHLDGELQHMVALELIRTLLHQGQETLAEERLVAFIAQADLPETVRKLAQADLGTLYLRQNRQQEAVQLLHTEGQSRALIDQLANFYYQHQAFAQVRDLYAPLLADQPRAIDYVRHGTALFALGELVLAQADFEAALALDPLAAEALHNLGSLALRAGDQEQAQAFYQRAQQADPTLYSPWLDLGKLALHAENFLEGRRLLERALVLSPEHPEILELLAWTLGQSGDPGRASGYWMDLLDLNPHHPTALVQLGHILAEAQEYGRALQVLERALDLPEPPDQVYTELGLLFLQTGRYDDARNAFLLACQRDPENPELLRALQLADQLAPSA